MRRVVLAICCAGFWGACNRFAPFRPATPRVDARVPAGGAPRSAAVLVIVYPENPSPPSLGWVDVVGRDGQVLARLRPGSWTSLERPAGRSRLYLVPAFAAWNALGPGRIGFVDADLEPGRYYYARVLARPVPFADFNDRTWCGRHRSALELRSAWRPTGEIAGGVRETLLPRWQLPPVPRGMLEPDMERIQSVSRARAARRCPSPEPPKLGRSSSTLFPLGPPRAAGS